LIDRTSVPWPCPWLDRGRGPWTSQSIYPRKGALSASNLISRRVLDRGCCAAAFSANVRPSQPALESGSVRGARVQAYRGTLTSLTSTTRTRSALWARRRGLETPAPQPCLSAETRPWAALSLAKPLAAAAAAAVVAGAAAAAALACSTAPWWRSPLRPCPRRQRDEPIRLERRWWYQMRRRRRAAYRTMHGTMRALLAPKPAAADTVATYEARDMQSQDACVPARGRGRGGVRTKVAYVTETVGRGELERRERRCERERRAGCRCIRIGRACDARGRSLTLFARPRWCICASPE
jgi:hypothetical protein